MKSIKTELPDTQTKKSGKKVAFGPSQNPNSGIYKEENLSSMISKNYLQNALEQAQKYNAHFGLRDPHLVQSCAHDGYLKAIEIFDETVSQNIQALINRCVYNAMRTAKRDMSRYYKMYQDVYKPDGEGGYYFDESCLTSTYESSQYIQTQTEKEDLEKRFADARKTLTNREKQVINLHLGFTEKPLTKSQTANLLGISERRVQQLYNSGIKKLKNILYKYE